MGCTIHWPSVHSSSDISELSILDERGKLATQNLISLQKITFFCFTTGAHTLGNLPHNNFSRFCDPIAWVAVLKIWAGAIAGVRAAHAVSLARCIGGGLLVERGTNSMEYTRMIFGCLQREM